MEQGGLLILAQADHLTGEEMGFAIDQILAWGAYNVYAFPGITKKNRSGCVLLIDADPAKEADLGRLLAAELAIYGYHRILTSHYCSECRLQTNLVIIRNGDISLQAEVRFKSANHGKCHGRIEHADLLRLREQIMKELGLRISLTALRAQIDSRFLPDVKTAIEIDL
ncbi:MAG: DUF111 family protein [Candidatus Lindowbacteria bacterium]|nr:DUF111 family protein [Candidatus Lindowbacteria bacterium]